LTTEKDRRIGSDSQCQSRNRSNRKAGSAPQLAKAKTNILPKRLQAGTGSTIPHRLLHLLNPAGLGQCATPRLGCCHAARDPFVGDSLQVGANFLVKLALNPRLANEIAKSPLQARPECHRSFP
jgi:hypothetical protein